MLRRIFIAINLPKEIKEDLGIFQKKYSELPAKWVKPENLHITLVFLGYVKEKDLSKIIEITRNVASKHHPFSMKIIKVSYGPPKIFPPRMVWVIGEKNENLSKLQEDLKSELGEIKIAQLDKDEKNFIPHITLARIKQFEFRKMEMEEIPEINEDLNLSFQVNSIEIMESHLKRNGAEYIIFDSLPLSQIN